MDHKKNESTVQGPPPPKEGRKQSGNHAREDYAGHLARVTPDAEGNKARLQARYRALHLGEAGAGDS
jgi:hypothetical protein